MGTHAVSRVVRRVTLSRCPSRAGWTSSSGCRTSFGRPPLDEQSERGIALSDEGVKGTRERAGSSQREA